MENFDYHKARKFLGNRIEVSRRRKRWLFQKAWQDFDSILKLIIDQYNPKRVYQWGSLLSEEDFCEISDIDIAVEGIESAETFFRLFGEVMGLTDFPLDLVEIDKIDPLHADSIRLKGRLVYERK
jgi:predicted nucleotidyltransferase